MRQTDSLTRKDGETDTHTAGRHTDTLPNCEQKKKERQKVERDKLEREKRNQEKEKEGKIESGRVSTVIGNPKPFACLLRPPRGTGACRIRELSPSQWPE